VWRGIPLEETVFYEIHVGTFSRSGTFRGILERLEALASLGVNALNLMPVAQFPGERNWGYDGVYPFAVQLSYGGPDGLKELVNACHQLQMAVYLDVVYNHLAPKEIIWAGSVLISPRNTRPPGAMPSTTTDPTATVFEITSFKTPSTGFAAITSTDCAWTRCTPSVT